MAAGKVDRIEVRRVDLVGRGCRLQKGHAVRIIQPGFRRGVQKRPFEGARLKRRDAAQRTYDRLPITLLRKDVIGMSQLRQPQAGRLGRISIVGDIADDMENAFGHLLASSRMCRDIASKLIAKEVVRASDIAMGSFSRQPLDRPTSSLACNKVRFDPAAVRQEPTLAFCPEPDIPWLRRRMSKTRLF